MSRKQMVILFVKSRERSREFYSKIFGTMPVLDVPGMTEFEIPGSDMLLGLMPEEGISKILAEKTPQPASGNGIPRCELYLYMDEIDTCFSGAISAGASEISRPQLRSWGDYTGYVSDPDGNVIAFAKR